MGAPRFGSFLFGSLRGYRRAWLRADLLAGLAVWAVLVPVGFQKSARACDLQRSTSHAPGMIPGRDVDRCRSQARADYWNPTGTRTAHGQTGDQVARGHARR